MYKSLTDVEQCTPQRVFDGAGIRVERADTESPIGLYDTGTGLVLVSARSFTKMQAQMLSLALNGREMTA